MRLLFAIQFSVDMSGFTDIHPHHISCSGNCICLPPRDRIDNEYRCGPAPHKRPETTPVIASSRLTHFLKSPSCIDSKQKSILTQLPKRTCGRLVASPEEEVLGWGLHFKRGWHTSSVYFVALVFVLAGLVFGICWSSVKGDIQGGFSMTQVWIFLGPFFIAFIANNSL